MEILYRGSIWNRANNRKIDRVGTINQCSCCCVNLENAFDQIQLRDVKHLLHAVKNGGRTHRTNTGAQGYPAGRLLKSPPI